MDWNHCPESNGIGVRIAPEWVSGMPRNKHQEPTKKNSGREEVERPRIDIVMRLTLVYVTSKTVFSFAAIPDRESRISESDSRWSLPLLDTGRERPLRCSGSPLHSALH